MQKYAHLVEVDEQQRCLSIYRVFESGERNLYTRLNFPPKTYDADRKAYQDFAQLLGENLIFDSQAARRVFDL